MTSCVVAFDYTASVSTLAARRARVASSRYRCTSATTATSATTKAAITTFFTDLASGRSNSTIAATTTKAAML